MGTHKSPIHPNRHTGALSLQLAPLAPEFLSFSSDLKMTRTQYLILWNVESTGSMECVTRKNAAGEGVPLPCQQPTTVSSAANTSVHSPIQHPPTVGSFLFFRLGDI